VYIAHIKKICQCLECCSVQTVGKKYITQIINGESLIPDVGKAIIFWSHWHFPPCHLNSVANNSFTAAILTLTALLMLLPYCSLQKSFLFLYMLFSFSTCSLLQNPVDHSAVVAVSANQLLQENWLRENLIQLWRH